jgi:hypothetical protein
VFGGLLVTAAVAGVIAWSRRQYTPRLFLAGTAVMFVMAVAGAANGWPALLASLITAVPLPLQIAGVVGIGLVGVLITAVLVGLALGALPHWLATPASPGASDLNDVNDVGDGDVLRLGIAAGLVGAALSVAGTWLQTPAWAHTPNLSAFGSVVPLLQVAIDPVTGLLTRTAVILSMLAAIDRMTSSWTRRRALAVAALSLVGFLSAGVPPGSHVGGWVAAGLVMAAALPTVYVTLLRFDLTMVPIGLGTTAAVEALARGAQRPFPGALGGSLLAALVVALVAWWWFRALRRWRARIAPASLGTHR